MQARARVVNLFFMCVKIERNFNTQREKKPNRIQKEKFSKCTKKQKQKDLLKFIQIELSNQHAP